MKVEGLNDRAEVNYYLGKRVVYVFKSKSGFNVWNFIILDNLG